MPVTLTVNYKEVYSQETVNKIEELLEDSFCLEDIVEFIDENSEEDFCNYYEDYVNVGEEYSYGAVDAFIEEFVSVLLPLKMLIGVNTIPKVTMQNNS